MTKRLLITGASTRHRPRAGARLCGGGREPLSDRAATKNGSRRPPRPAAPPAPPRSMRPSPMCATARSWRTRSRPRNAERPIDILVANAGVATGLSPGQIVETPEAVRATLAINVNGVFNTVEPAIAAMCARRAGQIAIVGSMAGVRGLPYSPAYCATKAAVHL